MYFFEIFPISFIGDVYKKIESSENPDDDNEEEPSNTIYVHYPNGTFVLCYKIVFFIFVNRKKLIILIYKHFNQI